MRTRITFLAGFAAGFVAGARAGRERYEQIVKLGRKAAENPAVRQAARAAGTKATELSKTAGQKAAERMPKLAETAKNSASKARSSASKVRIPGRNSAGDDTSAANGARPVD
jgi:FtsP/CotA-like multicopper oxidase with cupredoxin domain